MSTEPSGNSPPAISPVQTVAVIGAGTAGRGFALACAAAGFHVVLEDVMPANLRRAQEEYAVLSVGGSNERTAQRGKFEVAPTIEAAVRNADVVVDFVPDELESKLEIFCLVDRMAPPKTAILTPSDAQNITDLASCTYRGDRCLAIRGGLQVGATVRLLYPANASAPTRDAIAAFLRALGYLVSVEFDTEAPMLTKNLPQT